MSPDPFFQPDSLWTKQTTAEGRLPCRCHLPSGFCSACIHPKCLRLGADGSVRVGLSVTPENWFNHLSELGQVLHLTRNEVAVLGQIASVPALQNWRNPVLPRDTMSLFTPNLAEHASLWAVREASPLGTAYGFEARDVSGYPFQRIVLTAPAKRELFERFVTDHQSPPEEAAVWFSPNHTASTQRRHMLTRRMRLLRAQYHEGAPHLHKLRPETVPKLFSMAAKLNLPLRTTHYTPALVRSALWTPEACDPSNADTKIEFIHGEQTGLHLLLPAIAEVWLWQGRCDCCDKNHWGVEIADRRGQVALAITAGDGRLEAAWRDVLNEISRGPH